MTRVAAPLFLLVTFACAMSSPIKRVSFADGDVPEGSGWMCFTANNGRDVKGVCGRSAESCEDQRAQQRSHGQSVSACKPTATAYCYYADYDASKSGAIFDMIAGGREKKLACFDSEAECNEVAESWSQNGPAGTQAVSHCRQIN